MLELTQMPIFKCSFLSVRINFDQMLNPYCDLDWIHLTAFGIQTTFFVRLWVLMYLLHSHRLFNRYYCLDFYWVSYILPRIFNYLKDETSKNFFLWLITFMPSKMISYWQQNIDTGEHTQQLSMRTLIGNNNALTSDSEQPWLECAEHFNGVFD